MIEVVDITTNKKLYKSFADFPNILYKDSPYYVPYLFSDEANMLNAKKNIALKDCTARYFLAYKDGKIAGRIGALIIYEFNKKVNEKRVRFTRFDCINDLEVAKALFSAVEDFAINQGMDIVHGPFGFNDMDREGYLTMGFDRKATLATNYNYEYYDDLIKKCGYQKECMWNEYLITIPPKDAPHVSRLYRIADMVKKRYNLRLAESKNIGEHVKKYRSQIFDIFFRSYGHLPGFIDFSPEMQNQIITQFKQMLTPPLIPVVVDQNNNGVGFALCFPDVTDILIKYRGRLTLSSIIKIIKQCKTPTGLEMGLIGVVPEWQNKGVNAILITAVLDTVYKLNIKTMETNPEYEQNHQVQAQWDDFEKQLHKQRICVYKTLS